MDVIGVADKIVRAKEARELGAEFIEFHAGLDEQTKDGYSLDSLLTDRTAARVPFSVAGGVNVRTVNDVAASGADVAVVGSDIYSAPNPGEAARALPSAIG